MSLLSKRLVKLRPRLEKAFQSYLNESTMPTTDAEFASLLHGATNYIRRIVISELPNVFVSERVFSAKNGDSHMAGFGIGYGRITEGKTEAYVICFLATNFDAVFSIWDENKRVEE